MRCEDVLNQLNARVDGESRAEDAAELDAHLAECSQCGVAAEGLQTIDAELRRAFVPRRVAAARLAESAAARISASAAAPASIAPSVVPAPAPAALPAPGWAWGQILVASAAGFLLAIAMFRPWPPKLVVPDVLPLREPIAHLAIASGPVETRPVGDLDLSFFACPEEGPINRDSIVRTGPSAQCEIALKDGNALRLDCNTEVTLHESEMVEVSRGRLWSCSQPGQKALEIRSGGGTIMAQPATELAVLCQPPEVQLIVVGGAVNVQAGRESIDVGPGKRVRIIEGKLQEDAEWCDALLETAWVNDVLALRSSDDPELAERVNRLLANVGAAKLSLLYEDELRRLGDGAVPPLLAYLGATRDTPNIAPRTTAARIVADVAPSRWIADLIALLTDANADVRFHAARGLERLTGRDQDFEARSWQSANWASCQEPHQKWLNWWSANRDRYPAARRDIPAPTSPPF